MLISTAAKFRHGDFVQSRTGGEEVFLVRAVIFRFRDAIEYELSFGNEISVLAEEELVPMVEEATGKVMNVEDAGERGVVKMMQLPPDDEDEADEAE